jgi:hypothetical protein
MTGSAARGPRGAPRRRFAPSRAPRSPRITDPAEHVKSRTGGRAVHGIVPTAFEFRWAQYRVGLPREWRPGKARHSHQAGRRDARRWPKPHEDDERLTPPQGGEPEQRRDQRRMRRQAGGAEYRTPATASASGSASADSRGPKRSRISDTVTGHGVGHGRGRRGEPRCALRQHGSRAPHVADSPLHALLGAPESRALLST